MITPLLSFLYHISLTPRVGQTSKHREHHLRLHTKSPGRTSSYVPVVLRPKANINKNASMQLNSAIRGVAKSDQMLLRAYP